MEHWSEIQKEEFHYLADTLKAIERDYEYCGIVLADEVEKKSRNGNYSKIGLIIFGALVATKGIADQFMIDYGNKTIKMLLLIIFTIIGIMISIVAGFDSTFKYAEIAAGLRILSAQTQTNIRLGQVKRAINYNVKEFSDAIAALNKDIEEQVRQLEDIYGKAAFFGLDLASKANKLKTL